MKNLNFEKLAYEFQTTAISLTKMAEREGVDRRTLSKHFKDLGIEVINKHNITKFNENVFDTIDNEEKAYWLGFIFADGSIRSKENGKKTPYTFELSLKADDVEHLYKFNKFMQYKGNNVKIQKAKYNNKEFLRCRWIITNKHLWNTLNVLGCTPNKSLTLCFPNIDSTLYSSFIRGYFDGDGCISRHLYVNTVSPNISLIGTKEFLESIQSIINITSSFSHDSRHHENTFSLNFNKESGIAFINYLYKNATIYLDRKYKLFQFFKNGSRSIQEWIELSSSNIGGGPLQENPEINSETKESESSYSVEGET